MSLAELREATQADLRPIGDGDLHEIGGYKLLARIHTISQSRLYIAACSASNRLLLAKTLPRGFEAAALVRFDREVRNAQRIAGRHFAAIFDYAMTPVPTLFQEYIVGPSLSKYLHQSAAAGVRPSDASTIATAVLEALSWIHDAGVAHRDLKAENIILHATRGPVVVDFGISAHAQDPRLTADGFLIGTPSYMAPERFEGNDDLRSDVFSWGVLAARLFSGRHPFDPEGTCQSPRDYYLRLLARAPDLSGVPTMYHQPIMSALAPIDERSSASQVLAMMDQRTRQISGQKPHTQGGSQERTLLDFDLGEKWLEKNADFALALIDTRRASAARARRDVQDIVGATSSTWQRLAVRIEYSRAGPLLCLWYVRTITLLIAVFAGMATGLLFYSLFELLWLLA